jgi:hypothetical protein
MRAHIQNLFLILFAFLLAICPISAAPTAESKAVAVPEAVPIAEARSVESSARDTPDLLFTRTDGTLEKRASIYDGCERYWSASPGVYCWGCAAVGGSATQATATGRAPIIPAGFSNATVRAVAALMGPGITARMVRWGL